MDKKKVEYEVYKEMCEKQTLVNERVILNYQARGEVESMEKKQNFYDCEKIPGSCKSRTVMKKKEKNKCFLKLPYQIVINEILVFYELIISKKYFPQYRSFEGYGYFRRDKYRNIWFLFKSINLYKSFIDCGVFVSVRSIENLVVDVGNDVTNTNTLNLSSLKSLRITFKVETRLENFFSQISSSVKNLEDLTLCRYDDDMYGMKEDIKFFPKKFCFLGGYVNVDSYFKSDCAKRIEDLKLTGIDFKNVNSWVKMENLKVIRLKSIKQDILDFFKTEYTNLQELSIYRCLFSLADTSDLFSLRLNFLKLKKLKLEGQSDTILILGSFPELESLMFFRKDYNTETNFEKWKKFKKLKKLYLSGVGINDEIFKGNKLPNIEVIEVTDFYGSTKTIIGKNWSKMPKLRKIICVEVFLRDDVFRNQKFEFLDYLKLHTLEHWSSGFEWKKIPNLRTLQLPSLLNCSFFCENNFYSLRRLVLSRIKNPLKHSLTDFPVLIYIKIENSYDYDKNYPSINDKFFSEVRFPKLRIVILERIDEITGEGWKTPSVKHAKIKLCSKFNDSFFKGKSKLKYVGLFDLESVTGCGWDTFNICFLNVERCKGFDVDCFMQVENFSRFPKMGTIFFKDTLFTGEKWCVIPFIFDCLCKYASLPSIKEHYEGLSPEIQNNFSLLADHGKNIGDDWNEDWKMRIVGFVIVNGKLDMSDYFCFADLRDDWKQIQKFAKILKNKKTCVK